MYLFKGLISPSYDDLLNCDSTSRNCLRRMEASFDSDNYHPTDFEIRIGNHFSYDLPTTKAISTPDSTIITQLDCNPSDYSSRPSELDETARMSRYNNLNAPATGTYQKQLRGLAPNGTLMFSD